MKYMVWNNKGGVGKTFITFILASEYALAHPDEDVVVVDLCPQANVSEMLLGGNGKGETNLQKCYDNQRTIASYIKARYDKSRFGKLGDETEYFVKVADYNDGMPVNMYLIPGDMDLDICSTIINYLAQAPEKSAWVKSRKFLVDLIEPFNGGNKNRKKVFFFDCNPSFANYTEMAVIASDRIIVPCTADAASIRGIHNLFRMIYGIKAGQEFSDDAVFDTFSSKIKESGIKPPKVHLFIQNKSRVLDASATSAFKAHIQEIKDIASVLKKKYPDHFTDNKGAVLNVKDGNTLTSILNHTGLPLSKVQPKTYSIYGKRTQANQTQIEPLLDDIKKCLAVL
ncbi:ParA family protein [Trichlorobacter lovleyi]|uniref:ATPase domain protein n=1 Tax=Trichlorobacter lovleyi (strain ATCC BAA-1151 / DSM 17278 / SZ) TaxID=398767 RepID=B3E6E7_TRIL1|nr:ParA family protein [Trichlorobacter lovleyi]ACD96294.1 ATPase domain protein [Trichlorobacter lovleyi SZ]